MLEAEIDFQASSPMRRRWARRSFRKKSPSPGKSRNHSVENTNKHEEAVKEAEKLLHSNEEEMKTRLEMLSNRNGSVYSRTITHCVLVQCTIDFMCCFFFF